MNYRTLHPDTRNETWVDMITALVAGVILAGVLYACFLIGQGNIRANTTNPTTRTDTATTQRSHSHDYRHPAPHRTGQRTRQSYVVPRYRDCRDMLAMRPGMPDVYV